MMCDSYLLLIFDSCGTFSLLLSKPFEGGIVSLQDVFFFKSSYWMETTVKKKINLVL